MPATLDTELQEQRRWRIRPVCRPDLFEALLRNEFLSPEQHHASACSSVRYMAGFVEKNVPYYGEMFRRLGITARDFQRPEDLCRLPSLSRAEAKQHAALLHAVSLPPQQQIWRTTETSGSTGEPVEVPHTFQSRAMFSLLKQRELRWFRFDPSAKYAEIRPTRDMPPQPDGQNIPVGTCYTLPSWPAIGQCVETGPFFGLSHMATLERQIEWLDENRPSYLLAQSANLEHLALTLQGRRLDYLRALQAISQELSPAMRRCVESVFGVPVHENYGLNEFGVVASRCPEGGRFHVHLEHCIVEIVDESGQPCPAGQVGQVLVTGLSNMAMPLLRYETGDLAEALEGPCPCGRTLPSFGNIRGRYRRIAFLPPGTWTYWTTFQREMFRLPQELLESLRQYQMHQYRDGSFELKLVVKGQVQPALIERFREIWRKAGGASPAPLTIRQVESIPRPPGGKFQNFTSDFMPPRDSDSPGPSTA